MSTIAERISFCIEHFGLKRNEFAKQLGLSSPFVSELCSGRKAPSDRTIADICRVYNVDEVWLRTGAGQPFTKKSRRDVIDEYIGQLSEGKRSDIEQLLIELMAETSVEEWAAISSVFRKLADKLNKPDTE